MNKKHRQIVSLLLAIAMLVIMLAGCKGDVAETATPTVNPADTSEDVTPTPDEDLSAFPFPMAETFELSLIFASDATVLQHVNNPNEDFKFYKMLSEMFNVSFDMTVLNLTAMETQLNIIIASDDVPDIVSGINSYYVGGVSAALEDDVIIDISQYLDGLTYYPQVMADEDIARDVYTNGQLGAFYKIYEDNYGILSGPTVRQDWLDELGMDMPTTFDGWEEMLEAFKVTYDPKYCLALSGRGVCTAENLSSGFGVRLQYWTDTFNSSPFYITGGKDGEVNFGPMEDGCLEYLTMMNRWYEAGYFDDDFVSYTGWVVIGADNSDVPTDDVGVAFASAEKVQAWVELAETEGFRLAPIADPTKDGIGEEYVNHNKSRVLTEGWSVSTSCENPLLVCQLIDWFYSEDGYILSNYGIDYEYDASGNIQLSDAVLRNELGLDSSAALSLLGGAAANPHVFNLERNWKYYTEDQKDCLPTWNAVNTNSDNWAYPTGAIMTAEEQGIYDKKMTDILTYISENFLNFIFGNKSLDTFDQFVAEIEGMGVQEIIDIKQAALDRYMG